MAGPINSGARLDRLPICGFHWRLLGLIGAGMFLDGFEIFLAGGVIGYLVKNKWAPLAFGAQFVSAGVFGMMLGSWLSGVLGDRYGRRFSYQLNLLVFGLASFAAAAAPTPHYLVLARFVMGIGLGAEVVVGYATLIEYIPPSRRGRWGAGLTLCTNSAIFVSALAGYFVLPTIGWRWLFIVIGIAAMIIWYLRKTVPESPRWLESKGREAEAEAIVAGIEREALTTKPGFMATPLAAPIPPHTEPEIMSREMLARFAVGMIIFISANASAYGFVVWLPTLLERMGLNITSSLGFTTVMSIGAPVGALTGVILSDRFNRKSTTVCLSILVAFLGMIFPFAHSHIMALAIGFAFILFNYLLVSVTWSCYVPELFPTRIRLRASGTCNAMGRIAGSIMPFAVLPLFRNFGVLGVVSLVSCVMLFAAAIVAMLGIETNSRSLEALEPGAEEAAAKIAERRNIFIPPVH